MTDQNTKSPLALDAVPVDGGVVFRSKSAHRCQEPEPRKFDIGDVFKCRTCHTEYVLTDAQNYQGGPFWKRRS